MRLERKRLYEIARKLTPHLPTSTGLSNIGFAKIELLLYLFHRNTSGTDVRKAHLLLSGLNLIGLLQSEMQDYMLLNARQLLRGLHSKIHWEDQMRRYFRAKDSIRLFLLSDEDKVVMQEGEHLVYPNRVKEYEEILLMPNEKSRDEVKLAAFGETYSFIHKKNVEVLTMPNYKHKASRSSISPKKRKGGKMTVSIDELKSTATKMDQLLGKQQFEPESRWVERLERVKIKQHSNGKVSTSARLEIAEVCNVVGMVGAGKSTFMNILAYWAAKKEYRLVMVLDTVSEVVRTVNIFKRLNIHAVPLLGRYSKNDQINKTIDEGEMYLKPGISELLTTVCPLDGLRKNTSNYALEYGNEPCYSLKKGSDYNVCPFYYDCPSTAFVQHHR